MPEKKTTKPKRPRGRPRKKRTVVKKPTECCEAKKCRVCGFFTGLIKLIKSPFTR